LKQREYKSVPSEVEVEQARGERKETCCLQGNPSPALAVVVVRDDRVERVSDDEEARSRGSLLIDRVEVLHQVECQPAQALDEIVICYFLPEKG